jgi:hypothetical protein
MTKLLIICLLLMSVLADTSDADDLKWRTVSIPKYCIFQIPSTLELQSGTYKLLNDEYRKSILEISKDLHRIVAQPAGVNSFDPDALKLYCRVIVETTVAQAGDYLMLGQPIELTRAELRQVDASIHQQAQVALQNKLIAWRGSCVVSIGTVQAIESTYSRRGIDGPVVVRTLEVHNNDACHILNLSYRESEAAIWAKDIEALLQTFRFVRR